MEKKRVLIIDDEVTFTRMLRLNLEKDGRYEVREENRGRRASAAAREFKPHIIFLDVIMPDVNGGEVAALIQSDPKLKHIPIVFLTATLSPKEAGRDGTLRGGFSFLAKPVSLSQLVEYIEKHTEAISPAKEANTATPPTLPQGRNDTTSADG